MFEYIERLKEGNRRFMDTHPHIPIAEQDPFCAVLACADSRVSPEILFRQDIGDVFVVRHAGNIATDSAIDSLRLAVERLHIKLIVVMGHQDCAAIAKENIIPNVHKQVERLKKEFPMVEVVGSYFDFHDGSVSFL